MLSVLCWHALICIIYRAKPTLMFSLSEAGIIIILLWLLRDCLAFPFSKTTTAILCVEAKGCQVKQKNNNNLAVVLY